MKQQSGQMGSSSVVRCLALAFFAVGILVALVGCNTGTPDPSRQAENTGNPGLPNASSAAPFLSDFDNFGNYIPYVQTAEMKRPRYLHEAVAGRTGLIYAFGGSDERGLSALDSLEIFDQSTFDRNESPPESKAGLWLDTNFEGDPIAFVGGPRILFAAAEISESDNRILMVGGTASLLAAAIIWEKPEIFDPTTRMFEELDGEMLIPRFRHSMVKLTSGEFLVVGGQILEQITTQLFNFVVVGQPQIFQQFDAFPSIPDVESFSLREGEFSEVFPASDDDNPTLLKTPRGRAGHAMTRIAGPNNRMNNADDLFVIVGGYETLSATSGLAPLSKQPGRVANAEAEGSTSVEVYDPLTRNFTLIASVRLNAARINFPQVVNLGQFNDFTPDGVIGLGNAILISHGNTDELCPITPLFDELFIANYLPGGGPASGLRFFHVEDLQFFSHIQGSEYGLGVSRCATNVLTRPRRLPAQVGGVSGLQTWAFSLAGVHIFLDPLGNCIQNYTSPTMAAGCVFDPFYNVRVANNNGLSPRDLTAERRANINNFLGILGAWFTLDGFIPTESLENYGGTPINRWPQTNGGARVFLKLVPLAGVDGLANTADDRILITGGGRSFFDNGGEPTAPSAEILLLPGAAEQ